MESTTTCERQPCQSSFAPFRKLPPERAANALSAGLGGGAKCAPAGARVAVVVLVMAFNVGLVLVLLSLLVHSLGLKLLERLRNKVPCAARGVQVGFERWRR